MTSLLKGSHQHVAFLFIPKERIVFLLGGISGAPNFFSSQMVLKFCPKIQRLILELRFEGSG